MSLREEAKKVRETKEKGRRGGRRRGERRRREKGKSESEESINVKTRDSKHGLTPLQRLVLV